MIHKFRISKGLTAAVVAVVALALGGCIRDNFDSEAGSGMAIVFSPSVQGATRAASGSPIENDTNIAVGASFGVFAASDIGGTTAWFTGLDNEQVGRTSTGFTYSPVAMWPRESGAKMAFLGYYPYIDPDDPQTGDPQLTVTKVNQNTDEYGLSIDYTVPADPSGHIDLMYAKTAMMTGFDPVELHLQHALTRIKFTAYKRDYTGEVKITGITVKGAKTAGTLNVWDGDTQPGQPSWTLGSASADYALTTSNGLADIALGTASQSIMTGPGADMLVIPQSVTDIEVWVTATNDGVAFAEPLVFPLATSPDWQMNHVVAYDMRIGADGMTIEASVGDWDMQPVGTIYDGPYYLRLNYDRLDFHKEGGDVTLEIRTNYDAADGLAAEGSTIDKTGLGSWAAVTDQGQTVSGDEYVRTVKVTAAAFTGAADKTPTSFTIKVRNINYTFHLTQSKDPWLVAEPTFYMLDGEVYSFDATANVDWTVAIKDGTNEVSGVAPMPTLFTRSGNKDETNPVYFSTKDNTVGTPIGNSTVTLLFTDPTGINRSKEVGVSFISEVTSTPINAGAPYTYVGAFWRADQTGERLIRIQAPSTAIGGWSATVLHYGGFKKGEIVFSTDPSADPEIDFSNANKTPADMNVPANDALYSVDGNARTVGGNITAAGQYIFFRIGLKSKWDASNPLYDAAKPARYAIVVISYKYGSTTRFQKLYLRQGHEPDYLMGENDGSGNNAVSSRTGYAKRFSPYNSTVPGLKNADQTQSSNAPIQPSVNIQDYFTDYPSQAGALYQYTPDYFHATETSDRYAFSPSFPVSSAAAGWKTSTEYKFWDELEATTETCPQGYRRIRDGSTSGENRDNLAISEIRQSLWYEPKSGSNNNSISNSVWGFYADGFFDRRAIGTQSNYTGGSANTAVSVNNNQVAYVGRLFFNPINTSDHYGSSLFWPTAGLRWYNAAGHLSYSGTNSYYWTSSHVNGNYGWLMQLTSSTAIVLSNFIGSYGANIRCVVDE